MTKRKFSGTPLSEELRQMEKKMPKVKAAADSYEQAKQRLLEGRSHPMPCRNLNCKWHNG